MTRSQGYRWLKEKVLSDDGRKQQDKLRELAILAATFDCTLAQLAIGKCEREEGTRLCFSRNQCLPLSLSFSLVFEK